jgi:hypothetical protein
MKKLMTIFASLSFLAVGSLLLAQNTSTQTTGQSETKTKSTSTGTEGKKTTKKSETGWVKGEVTKYEEGKSITVKGSKGEKTLDVDASTKITAKDIKEGSQVRVNWKEKDGKDTAVSISSGAAKKSGKKSSMKSSSETKTETSTKTSEPAPKTN